MMESELLTMDAGDELDIAIARLLGLTVNTTEERGHAAFSWDREWLDVWIETDGKGDIAVPEYSRDLNAAWKLVKDIRGFELHTDYERSEALIDNDDEYWRGLASIDEPALAICRLFISRVTWKHQEGGAE